MEIIANFYELNVFEYYELTSNTGNDNTWVWMAFDRPDGQTKAERDAPTFASLRNGGEFKDAFELAKLFLRATDHG